MGLELAERAVGREAGRLADAIGLDGPPRGTFPGPAGSDLAGFAALLLDASHPGFADAESEGNGSGAAAGVARGQDIATKFGRIRLHDQLQVTGQFTQPARMALESREMRSKRVFRRGCPYLCYVRATRARATGLLGSMDILADSRTGRSTHPSDTVSLSRE